MAKTGDAANLTAYRSLDFGAVTVLTDTTATETDATNAKGYYLFDLTAGETNGDINLYTCKSSTTGIACVAVPAVVHTIPATGILAPTTAGRTLDVSATGEAGVDWANVGSPTTTLALSGTTVGTVTTYTGNTPQTGDAYAQTNSGTFGLSAIKGYVDDIGVAGAGLTALGDARIANLDAAVTTRMATYTQPTGFLAATFPTTVAGTTNITGGTITTVTTTTNLTNAPTAGDFTAAMKTSLNAATPASVVGAVGSVTGNVGGSVASVATGGITAASLAADAITAAKIATDAGTEIAAAVWDLATTGHTTSGTFGASMNAAGSAGDPWSTSLPGAYGSGTAGHIVGTSLPDVSAGSAGGLFRAGGNAATSITTALTANLIGNVTGNLSGSVGSVTGAVGSVTSTVDANVVTVASNALTAASLATDAVTEIQSGLATASALTTVAGNVGTILTNTGTTIPGTLVTIASYVDTEVAAIKAKTDNLPSSPAAVGSAMTLANGAITEASITQPSEAAGRPTTILAKVQRLFEWTSNKRTRDKSTGVVTLRNAADSATLESQTQSTADPVDTQTKGV